MSTTETNEQENKPLDNEAMDAEFEQAWNEDDALDDVSDNDGDSEDEDTEVDEDADDDSSNAADDDGADNGDQPDSDETDTDTAGDDEAGDNPTDEKDVQHEKSWTGRLEKREAELAKKETEFKHKQEERRKKIRELMSDDDADTDWETLTKAAEELEMPEFALLTKKVQKLEQAQRTQLESSEAQSEFETESHKANSANQAYRDHVTAISAKHPDFYETVQKPEFTSYIDSLDPIAKAGADMVLKQGDAQQVITLLDSFSEAQTKPKPNTPNPADALVTTKRGASRPHSSVDMNDYESAWNEDD